ncbi:MAG: MarR family winged helix-turn-helix transcriptional regulator [Croceibacterium sp.]
MGDKHMAEGHTGNGRAGGSVALQGLVTMRMIHLFMLMRRGGIVAQRRRFGLSEIEWRIMTQLGTAARFSLNGLAEALVQDRGQLSRAVKGMVTRGLVTRERKPGGPEIEIALSASGRALHAEMVDWVVWRDARLTEGLVPGDLAALWRAADTMIHHAEELLVEEQGASV